MRICYVVNSVSETSVPATIATALADYEDLQVDILAWFAAERFEGDDRVEVGCLQAPNTTTGIDKKTYRKACNQLCKYDLIQVHTNHSGSIAKILGHRLDIPLVSREGNIRRGFSTKGHLLNGLTNRLADRIVPNSPAVYESFSRWERLLIDEENITIIPNGVDLERIKRVTSDPYNIHKKCNIPTDAIVVGTASVITEQKALGILVQALSRANNQTGRRLDLVIAGDGPNRKDIEQIAVENDLLNQVHFVGMVDRNTVYKIFSELDIYSMPSRWEGFSNAAVEALGTGTACVFSEIDPFLLPYRDVALFHRVDDVEDLANRLVELAEDPDLRNQYAQKGRELVEREYTLEQVAKQYHHLYTELI